MATAARALHFRLPSPRAAVQRREHASSSAVRLGPIDSGSESSSTGLKILLQPRLCTLRSYGSDRFGMIKTGKDGGGGGGGGEVSPFFEKLYEYMESSKKSHDFEIISGRLAMVVFAATLTMEEVTGNSLFRKMDLQGITEAGGLCLGAVTCAAIFAWLSGARNRVGGIFTISCNTFIDSLVDQIIDGLFFESELSDWSDEI